MLVCILYVIGRKVADGISGTDKNLLLTYSARELKKAEDDMNNEEKRFAAHSIDNKGNEFSLAEECARLLRIGREDGVKSEGGKSKKREDARGIKHREWWVDPPDEVVSTLKYDTCQFTTAAAQSGGTSSQRYHVYCCPQLGAGRVAMRRIPCPCKACDSTLRLDWVVGTDPDEQPRFQSVEHCQYRKVLGSRNEWDIVTLKDAPNGSNDDDIDIAKASVLVSLSSNIYDNIEVGQYGALVTVDENARDGYFIIEWRNVPYTQQVSGKLVCDAYYLEQAPRAPKWWIPSMQEVTVDLNNVVLANVIMDEIEKPRNMPSTQANRKRCLRMKALRVVKESDDYIFEEIIRRDLLEHEPRVLVEAEVEVEEEED